VARRDDKQPRKRFSKSGHTSHQPPQGRQGPPPDEPYRDPRYGPQPTQQYPQVPPPGYQPPRPPGYETARYAQTNPTERLPPPPRPGSYDSPTYHHVHGPPGTDPTAQLPATPPKNTVTRAVITRSNEVARNVTRKVINASKSDGAEESGLTAMIWNQVIANGTDAMITVALATTVFFGASTTAQRGNILLYLLVTMAPFAIVAPIIGPALDRLQHGRRWTMAGTAIGRAVLAAIMAQHPKDLLVLYPCALGSLVLSKAYSVVRASAAPKLVPPGMTLVEANSRLQIFSLAAGLIGGSFIGIVIKATGDSYSTGLFVTAIAYCVLAFFAIRLPKQIDSVSSAPPPRRVPRPAGTRRPPLLHRLAAWARRGFVPTAITSLQAESLLRFLAGFITLFLAFHIETTRHGWHAAFALGGILIGSGAGSFIGTGIGTRLSLNRPERVVVTCAAVAATMCLLTAILFADPIAIMAMFVSSATNGLAKIALDAVIQRDVDESLRSSAFGRSETFLQLSWVFGAAIAVALPSENGALGFWVAGGIVGGLTVLVVLRSRAMRRAMPATPRPLPPGSLPPGSVAPGHPHS